MEVSQLTDTGQIRSSNQDQVGVFYNQAEQALLLLCDGMGGHNAGDVASEMALYAVGHAWEESPKTDTEAVQTWLEDNIVSANDRVLQASEKYNDLSGMGTTIVGIAIIEGKGIVAHVGDSRAYCYDGEILKPLTRDHSFVQELLDMNMITPSEAQNHPQKNIVTQTVGVSEDIKVDISVFALEAQTMLLLCSDGLTDMLTADDIGQIIASDEDVNQAAQALIAAANQAGGRDNISVVLARIEGGDVSWNKVKWLVIVMKLSATLALEEWQLSI